MKMNNPIFKTLAVAAAVLLAVVTTSGKPAKKAITKKGNTVIVNTTHVVKGVRGYASATPLKIYLTNGKITNVEALPNQETPSVFDRAEKLLQKFVGKSVDEAQKMQVDAVSGATYSSKALIKTMRGGLRYYSDNK